MSILVGSFLFLGFTGIVIAVTTFMTGLLSFVVAAVTVWIGSVAALVVGFLLLS